MWKSQVKLSTSVRSFYFDHVHFAEMPFAKAKKWTERYWFFFICPCLCHSLETTFLMRFMLDFLLCSHSIARLMVVFHVFVLFSHRISLINFFFALCHTSVASSTSDFTLEHSHNKVYWVQCLILSSVLPFKCNEYIRLTLLLLPFVLSFVNRRNNENWTCEHRWQRTKTPRIKDCFVKIQNECLLSHSH